MDNSDVVLKISCAWFTFWVDASLVCGAVVDASTFPVVAVKSVDTLDVTRLVVVSDPVVESFGPSVNISLVVLAASV